MVVPVHSKRTGQLLRPTSMDSIRYARYVDYPHSYNTEFTMTLKGIIRCLLPRDMRSVEITSAWSLIILSFFLITSTETTESMNSLHPVEFWATITCIFGSLHLYSLVRLTKEEPVRLVTSWLSGTFWIWVGLSSGLNNPGDIATLILGVGCMAAFLINTMILSESWGK